MTKIFFKNVISLKWNLFLFILILIVGSYLGFIVSEEANRLGCFQIENDVIPVDIKQYSEERTQFIALGDVGTGNFDQLKVASGMVKVCEKSGCDFVLLLGDNFYPSGVESPNDSQFEKKFEQVYQKLELPFFVVLGNHDIKKHALSQVMYSLKSNFWYMPNYQYEFTTSNAKFFGLNTNCPLSFERLRVKLNDEKMLIKSNILKNPWKIVFGHHSIYSNGTHGDANIFIRSYWNWLLEGHVDLYLAGHNHNLAHFKTNDSDMEYVISGAGGAHYRSVEERKKLGESEALNYFTFNDIGFVWFELTMENLLMRFHDSNGEVIYEYSKSR